jgi:hypothetical protein
VEINEDVADRNQDGLTGWRKTQGKWVVEIGGRMSRVEVAGDICLRVPRPAQGCRADDDDNDDDDDHMFQYYHIMLREFEINILPSYTSVSNAAVGNTIYS